MRIGAIALLVLLVVAGSARAQGGPSDAERTALKVSQTDLRTALDYEGDAAILGEEHKSDLAHHAIRNAIGALDEMQGAARELTPPGFWATDWRAGHGYADAWSRFAAQLQSAKSLDQDALKEFGGDIVRKVEAADKLKQAMLELVTKTVRDACTVAVAVRGPTEVDGIPQGHSQLRVSVYCPEGIKELDLGIGGSIWTSVDAGPDPTKTAANGADLEVDPRGAKTVTVIAMADPDVMVGEVLAGDIIPIAGDGHPPIDEVM